MFAILALAALPILALLIYWYFSWKSTYWQRHLVFARRGALFFGNAKDLIRRKVTLAEDVKTLYDHVRAKHLKHGGYYFFTEPVFVPVDLNLVQRMLIRDFAHFTDHAAFINPKVEPLSDNLFNMQGHHWRQMRAKLTPTFTSGKMKMMFGFLLESATNLKSALDAVAATGQPLVIKDMSARFTSDVIMSCAFGLEANCLKNPHSEFFKYGKMIFEPSLSKLLIRVFTLVSPRLILLLRVSNLHKSVTGFFMNIVKSVVKYREENNIIRKDFMHLLIQLKNNVSITDDVGALRSNQSDASKGLTIEEVAAQAFLFWIAGFDTSSTTTAFCMYELSQDADIQERVRREIHDVLARHENQITYEALQELKYMEMCIHETLRKYPLIAVHSRRCTQDYKVPDSALILKKGSAALIPVLGIHHDPQIYPDPQRFDPERFTVENRAQRHPAAWIPFGDGPRICLGMRFGMIQMKLALVTLLKHYRFTLNARTKVPLEFDPTTLILTAKDNILLNFEQI